jgi:GNAT superfamily N-acetyltransferase
MDHSWWAPARLPKKAVSRPVMRGRPTGASVVSCSLRRPIVEELPTLSALCLRSKALWGYDEGFIDGCRSELTFDPCELRSSSIALAEADGRIVGVTQFKVTGNEADLLKLFIEPTMVRGGVGTKLFHWAIREAARMGADRMLIESDPDAAPFYRRMGAKDCGLAPSGSIAGRMLPKLVRELPSHRQSLRSE